MKDSEIAIRATWDRQTVGAHFSQDAAVLGPNKQDHEGYRLFIPPTGEPHAAVTIFPESGHIRVQTRQSDFHVRTATPPRLTASGMYVESADGSTHLLVTHAGAVAIQAFPLISEPLESPTSCPEQRDGETLDISPVSLPRRTGDQIEASGESVAAAQNERDRKTVRIVGRVGADPHFKEGANGLIANFPLAEHVEGQEQPVWHRVYTTGDRAQRLQEKHMTKGQEVRVDGYKQQRERQGRDGTTETVEVVYAAHVRLLRHGNSAPAQPEGTDIKHQHAAGARRGDTLNAEE